jgi:hypothetical protein
VGFEELRQITLANVKLLVSNLSAAVTALSIPIEAIASKMWGRLFERVTARVPIPPFQGIQGFGYTIRSVDRYFITWVARC